MVSRFSEDEPSIIMLITNNLLSTVVPLHVAGPFLSSNAQSPYLQMQLSLKGTHSAVKKSPLIRKMFTVGFGPMYLTLDVLESDMNSNLI